MNTRKQRDRLKILYDILKAIDAVRGGCLYISCIKQTAKLGFAIPKYRDRVENYFDTLKDHGLIIVASPQGKREATITKKGKQFIYRYERILKLFSGWNYN